MYEYFGGGETRNEELEMADDSICIYDGVGVFGEFVYLSDDVIKVFCARLFVRLWICKYIVI